MPSFVRKTDFIIYYLKKIINKSFNTLYFEKESFSDKCFYKLLYLELAQEYACTSESTIKLWWQNVNVHNDEPKIQVDLKNQTKATFEKCIYFK